MHVGQFFYQELEFLSLQDLFIIIVRFGDLVILVIT